MFPEHITVFLFVGLSFPQVSQTTSSNISTPVTPTTTQMVSNSSCYSPTVQPTTLPQEDCPADGKPTVESSCGRYVIPLYPSPWNDDLKDNSSCNYQILKKNLTNIICVELKIRVSVINLELTFKKAAGGWLTVEVKVCLDFKLEVVIDMEAVLHNFATNYTYEAVGVTFSEWKAKDGECKKCDGGGGPFMIESVCKEKEHSCRGQKNKSKESMDCAKYCSSSASAQVIAAVSNLILAMWISISYNF